MTAVVVHYGEVAESRAVAESMVGVVDSVVVVANDAKPRPEGLDETVVWLVPKRNLGFGSGFEAGCWHKPADVYLALNSDIELSEENIAGCLTEFDDPRVGVVAPTLVGSDGAVQSAVGTISRFAHRVSAHTRPAGRRQGADWVTGAVLFTRDSTLRSVGMDGSYFLLYEDVDYCLRVARAGWKVVCTADVATHHQSDGHSITGLRATYYLARNYLWFVRRNYGAGAVGIAYAQSVGALLRQITADTVRGRDYSRSRLFIRGLADSRRPPKTHQPLPSDPVHLEDRSW